MTILESIAGSATGALVKSALKKKGSHGTPKKRGAGHRAAKTEDRIAKALTDLRRSSSEDPALADFREDLFSELRKLIRPAIAQAKKGKPALLRILTRYSR
ncbi:MAG: hypothetical protein LAN61_10480 [Acidobacteriia bacterium]|nr:hypothetical protein [Terriglobia bacterium]